MKDIAIFGVGGFGREVLTLIQDINRVSPQWNIVGFFDDGHEKGEMINGVPVLGKTEDLNKWDKDLSITIAIGTPRIKKRIVEKINNPFKLPWIPSGKCFNPLHCGDLESL